MECIYEPIIVNIAMGTMSPVKRSEMEYSDETSREYMENGRMQAVEDSIYDKTDEELCEFIEELRGRGTIYRELTTNALLLTIRNKKKVDLVQEKFEHWSLKRMFAVLKLRMPNKSKELLELMRGDAIDYRIWED